MEAKEVPPTAKRALRDGKKQSLMEKVAVKGNPDVPPDQVPKLATHKIRKLSSKLSSIAGSDIENIERGEGVIATPRGQKRDPKGQTLKPSSKKLVKPVGATSLFSAKAKKSQAMTDKDSSHQFEREGQDTDEELLKSEDLEDAAEEGSGEEVDEEEKEQKSGKISFQTAQRQVFGLKKLENVKQNTSSRDKFAAPNTSSASRSRRNRKKHEMINSLSKEDYSFFYENSVWDQYEDFTYALQRGKIDQALKLYKQDGITLDEALRPSGDTVLHVCAEYGHDQLFKQFMSDPQSDPMARNYVDETPLHLACREGKLAMVQFLVGTLKCDVNNDTLDGWTPATYAAFNGFTTILEYLYKNNANLNFSDRLKRTPLHWACRYNQQEMALTLLRLGADYDTLDFEGKKAVDIAIDMEYKEMVGQMIQHHQYASKRRAASKL